MMKLSKAALIVGMGLTVVLFQNCAKVSTYTFGEDLTSQSNSTVVDSSPTVSNDGNADDDSTNTVSDAEPVDGSNRTSDGACLAALSGKSEIPYDSISVGQSAAKSFNIYEAGANIEAEYIDSVSNGASQGFSVKARSIASVSSFAAQSVSLNAQKIGKISNFSASLVRSVAHSIGEASNFAGVFCASVQNLGSLHDQASKLTIFGRSENGVKAKISDIHNISAFISLHDVDVASMYQGAINARIENGHIGSLSQGSGEIFLVNSTIDSIDNYAGVIHLLGSSSVGSQSKSAVQIIKH